jgi:hypothetical protein
MHQLGISDLLDRLKRLSVAMDPLEELARVIDFEAFRPVLDEALSYSDGAQGGRPPYDPLLRAIARTDGANALRVQGFDCGGAAHGERRADGVSDPRPSELDAFFGL